MPWLLDSRCVYFWLAAWAQASSGSLEQAKAALEAELEQAQAAVSAAEEAKAELAAKVQESKDAAEAAERFKAQLQPSLQSFEDQISVLEAQLPKPVQAHCACCLLAAMFGAARFGQVVQISSANQPVQAHECRQSVAPTALCVLPFFCCPFPLMDVWLGAF